MVALYIVLAICVTALIWKGIDRLTALRYKRLEDEQRRNERR